MYMYSIYHLQQYTIYIHIYLINVTIEMHMHIAHTYAHAHIQFKFNDMYYSVGLISKRNTNSARTLRISSHSATPPKITCGCTHTYWNIYCFIACSRCLYICICILYCTVIKDYADNGVVMRRHRVTAYSVYINVVCVCVCTQENSLFFLFTHTQAHTASIRSELTSCHRRDH